MLKNFRWKKKGIRIKCNKAIVTTHQMEDYESFPLWYHEEAICNIILLCGKQKKVTFDGSDRGGVFKVHTEHGPTKFVRHAKGLYDLNAKNNHSTTQW